nr:RNA-directed DNA polymerase, eukaryota, reverse transcriptase zinc-binding domain protein [Tanacetum cinerariifolium]
VKENEMQLVALVLDDSCYLDRDFSLSLMGKVKEFSSLSNLKLVLDTKGFTNITIKYIGEVAGWNPDFMEEEETQTESDNATIQSEIRGKWIPSSKFFLIISIYAPQELSDRKVLWDYLHFIIDNWADEVVIMGDFNEVRTQDERFGSIFNIQGAAIFNSFISSSGLVDVPIGGMFKGVSIGSNLLLSHLFYADDVVFLGQCKLMRIVVDDDIVNQAAHSIGCLQLKPPFSYIGLRIGGSMSRINSWDDIVNKLLARLSKWKMKTLSIGGRGVYIMEKKLSLVSWNKVLASKDRGGLGVSSFFAMNRALMFKWVWRFKTGSTSLWANFILAMHGKDGNLGTTVKSSFPSIWLDIIHDLHNLKNKGGAELEQFNDMINSLTDLQLPNMQDRWFWSLSGSGDFLIASVRKLIDDHLLLEVSFKFSWGKMVPIKVNILAWKLKLDVLPTQFNLSKEVWILTPSYVPSVRIVPSHLLTSFLIVLRRGTSFAK